MLIETRLFSLRRRVRTTKYGFGGGGLIRVVSLNGIAFVVWFKCNSVGRSDSVDFSRHPVLFSI